MSQLCRCKTRGTRRQTTKTTSLLLSILTLLLMPKCPMCLAAYVTLITGLSVSTAAASPLHATLMVACVSLLALTLASMLRGLRR